MRAANIRGHVYTCVRESMQVESRSSEWNGLWKQTAIRVVSSWSRARCVRVRVAPLGVRLRAFVASSGGWLRRVVFRSFAVMIVEARGLDEHGTSILCVH